MYCACINMALIVLPKWESNPANRATQSMQDPLINPMHTFHAAKASSPTESQMTPSKSRAHTCLEARGAAMWVRLRRESPSGMRHLTPERV